MFGFIKKLFKKEDNEQNVVKRPNQADVYFVENEEERMAFGIKKAKLTLYYFKNSLANPQPHQLYFALKARVVDGPFIEHLWLNDVNFDENNSAFGTVNNQPLDLKNVHLGQQIGVSFDDISDWMIVENGRLIGGYTIRAIRDGMKDKEKINFDRTMGLIIDYGVDYFPHDTTTPEGAILCLEDAFNEKDMDKAVALKDFREEAVLMLQKMEGFSEYEGKEELLDTTAEALRLSFIKSILDSGFPSFHNVERSFPAVEYLREDFCIVTEVFRDSNHLHSANKHYVIKKGNDWKVLGLVGDD